MSDVRFGEWLGGGEMGTGVLTPCQVVKWGASWMRLFHMMERAPRMMVGTPRSIAIWWRWRPAAFVDGWDVGWRVSMPVRGIGQRVGDGRGGAR